MSLKDDFNTLYNANLPDNATKQIVASKHREVEAFIENNAVWKDELSTSSSFALTYTRESDSDTTASASSFKVDNQTTPTKVYINSEAKEPNKDFGSLLALLSEDDLIYITNQSDNDNFLVAKVLSVYDNGYVSISEIVNNLSTASGDDYSISLDLKGAEANDRINNYFVKNYAELKNAVNLCGINGGGNIYCTGDIVFTGNVTWDCTGITFIGFATNWIMLNSNNESDGSLAKSVTISNGNPTFNGISFRGSQTTLASQTFSTYSNREIIKVSQSSSAIKFIDCNFNNIVGGNGVNPVVEYTTSLGANTETRLTFQNCFYNSANNSATFAMHGMTIEVTGASTARFNLNVTNQLQAGESWGSGGSDRIYNVDANTVEVLFYTDGTVTGDGNIDSFNTETLTTQAQEISSVTSGLKFPVVGTDGQAYWADIDDLKTYFNTP